MPFWVKKGKRQALCYRWIKWRILNRSYLTNKDMCDSNNAKNVFSRVLCFVSVLINMATNSLEPWKCHLLGHENVEKFKRQALCYSWIRMALSYSWEVPVSLKLLVYRCFNNDLTLNLEIVCFMINKLLNG